MGVKRSGQNKPRVANQKSAFFARRRRKPPMVPESTETDVKLADQAFTAFPIVGVGASAGGLEAFSQLLKHMPLDTGMALVLILHLDPGHKSALTHILARATKLPVIEIVNNQLVVPNHVYVIPPGTSLRITQGRFQLAPRSGMKIHRPIDIFFESLAKDRGNLSIGVVLSGTGSDGTMGLEFIKIEGGITFAQDESAKYSSMPGSAVAADCVDRVLSPAAIAQELAGIAKHLYVAGQTLVHSPPQPAGSDTHEPQESQSDETTQAAHQPMQNDYQKILMLLRKHSGVDFSFYKPTTIQRRIHRRVVLTKQKTLEAYAHLLSTDSAELEALYSDVLINVTNFFRDPEMYDVLQRQVLPALFKQGGDGPLRCWVLGCSSGQEAYSIAISFLETLEETNQPRTLQIFATDLNEAQLNKARRGLYPKSLAEDMNMSPSRLRRFFEEEDEGYRVSKQLRSMVVFARQNLTADPPFSRMDIISCRNLLIYLEPSLQKKSLPTFHYALKPGGFLILGTSESIGEFNDLFEIVDRKNKIFIKKTAATPPLYLPITPPGLDQRCASLPIQAMHNTPTPEYAELNAQREADRITVKRFAPPAVLVNADLQVIQFRGATGTYLEPPPGKASFNVLKMARDGVMLPLRTALNQAIKDNKAVRRENVVLKHAGITRLINLEVIPLKNLRYRAYLILFEESKKTVAGELKRGKRPSQRRLSPSEKIQQHNHVIELETELNETRDYIQSLQEQHETSVEALQAANEEVQSANEELQSVNEELETSKEELESSNEQLITLNEELSSRNIELKRLNNDLVNFQASTRISILLLGRDLSLRRFSPQAQKQFDLLATDLGRPISQVRHGLTSCLPRIPGEPKGQATPVDLAALLTDVMAHMYEKEHEVRDRTGRWYSLRVRPYLNQSDRLDGAVLVLVDIDAIKRGEQEMVAARFFAENTIATAREPLLMLDPHLRVESANLAFYRKFRVAAKNTVGRLIYDLGNRQWDIPRLRELLNEILPNSSILEDFQVDHHFEHIGHRIMLLNARRVEEPQSKHQRILLAFQDITDQKRAEQEMHVVRAQLDVYSQEVSRLNTAAESREQRIAELKKQVNDLYERLGQPAPYALAAAHKDDTKLD